MLIKLSDYVVNFFSKKGVDTMFAITGGASLHLIDSIARHPSAGYVCPHHEQGAAMAADGYARTSGGLGVALATSGPGATNLITGICCCYYDSVPVIFLTGQVSTFRMVGDTGVRQIGFQETPIVDICKPITKYAVQLSDPKRIRYELEKAIDIALSGRPGPVLIDIPDNLQRELVEESELVGFESSPEEAFLQDTFKSTWANEILDLIKASERPVIVAGWGIHLSATESHFIKFAEELNIPVVFTWGGADLMPYSHPLNVGTFGTHGTRHANFAVQNADLVLSLGSRLDTKSTGTPVNSFAREAKKIMIDIDASELGKFEKFDLNIDLLIKADLKVFFDRFNKNLNEFKKQYTPWFRKINEWRNIEYDARNNIDNVSKGINPYNFIRRYSASLPENTRLFVDTGCSIAWIMQAGQFKSGIRVFHDFNNTAMGWALPASIGSFFAKEKGAIHCVVGDGSFMMTMHELATLKHHKIPIKIFLMNNSGYSMIQQTQDQWLESRYSGSSTVGGLSFPEYREIAKAFGLDYLEIDNEHDLESKIKHVQDSERGFLCNVIVPTGSRVSPQVKFGRPNEDMEPLLPREVFNRAMIIKPLNP